MRIAAFIILMGALSSCMNHGHSVSGSESHPPAFDTFLTRFALRQLPITVRGCRLDSSEKLPTLDYEKDTVYAKINGLAYGSFATNGDYTALLTLAAADCWVPVLTTYDRYGKQIDSKAINIGQCGDGPGFTCSETLLIRPDYTIYTADTLSQQDVDSNEVVIPGGATFRWVVYRTGRLLDNGKIELSAEITDTVRMVN